MSLTVKTGKTSSEYFAVNKVITNETARTISIVYPCDILSPTVSVKGGYIDANYLTGLFGRNYWITNQTVDKGITYLHCNVDAWSSWSSNIYGSVQFVSRSETQGNNMINDTQYPNCSNPVIDVTQGDLITETLTYVLGVI